MSDNKAVFKFISVDKLILNPHSALIQGDSNHIILLIKLFRISHKVSSDGFFWKRN